MQVEVYKQKISNSKNVEKLLHQLRHYNSLVRHGSLKEALDGIFKGLASGSVEDMAKDNNLLTIVAMQVGSCKPYATNAINLTQSAIHYLPSFINGAEHQIALDDEPEVVTKFQKQGIKTAEKMAHKGYKYCITTAYMSPKFHIKMHPVHKNNYFDFSQVMHHYLMEHLSEKSHNVVHMKMNSSHVKAFYNSLKPLVYSFINKCSHHLTICNKQKYLIYGMDMSKQNISVIPYALAELIMIKHICKLLFGEITVGEARRKYKLKIMASTDDGVKQENDNTKLPANYVPKSMQKRILNVINQTNTLIYKSQYKQAQKAIKSLKSLI